MGRLHGENHPDAILSDEDVELIRQLYEEGQRMCLAERKRRKLGYRGIAARFECSCRTVRDIVHYRARLGV